MIEGVIRGIGIAFITFYVVSNHMYFRNFKPTDAKEGIFERRHRLNYFDKLVFLGIVGFLIFA